MPRYAKYNAEGEILSTYDMDAELIAAQCGEGEFYLECDAEPHDRIDVTTKTVIKVKAITPADITTKSPLKPYQALRSRLYPSIAEQLDMQFRDIANETFGTKDSEWFRRIELVKTLVPKKGEIAPSLMHLLGTPDETPEVPLNFNNEDYLNELEYLKAKSQ
jgi:hypothetical protein